MTATIMMTAAAAMSRVSVGMPLPVIGAAEGVVIFCFLAGFTLTVLSPVGGEVVWTVAFLIV
jgi:hypothetical protein